MTLLERQRQGLATGDELGRLVGAFRGLGGSDWALAEQILAVVLPVDRRAGLGLPAFRPA